MSDDDGGTDVRRPDTLTGAHFDDGTLVGGGGRVVVALRMWWVENV